MVLQFTKTCASEGGSPQFCLDRWSHSDWNTIETLKGFKFPFWVNRGIFSYDTFTEGYT